MFVDLIKAGESNTNKALELLCKAHGDDDSSIYDLHWSPFIRRLIELFSERGLLRLESFRKDLESWAEGAHHNPGALLPRPNGAMLRWSPEEQRLVKLYLESVPAAEWTMDDHMLMVDYMAQKHLPMSDLRTEAEWLATKSTMMGKVQAAMANLDEKQVDKVLQALPSARSSARDQFGLTPKERAVMDFAVTRAAEHVTSLADTARHQMRGIVARHAAARELGEERGPSLQTELLDEFGQLNRDWRRIAVTEAGEAQAQGYIAAQKPGTKVKRFEHYKNACNWCRKIDGLVMEVVDPSDPDKDGATQVWPGKTNVGRSAAPRKRQGDILVAREESEMWWPAAGTQHPHCRGAWLPVIEDQPGEDVEFGNWLRETLGVDK